MKEKELNMSFVNSGPLRMFISPHRLLQEEISMEPHPPRYLCGYPMMFLNMCVHVIVNQINVIVEGDAIAASKTKYLYSPNECSHIYVLQYLLLQTLALAYMTGMLSRYGSLLYLSLDDSVAHQSLCLIYSACILCQSQYSQQVCHCELFVFISQLP